MASRPLAKRASSSSAADSSAVGMSPSAREGEELLESVQRFGRVERQAASAAAGSSTMSPPFDHTNGASRMIDASTPSPY